MKKDIIVIILMVVAVVFGVGLRYYMQTGSLLPQEQTSQVQENTVADVAEENEEDVAGKVSGEQPQNQDAPDNDWGVMLSATEVTPDGMKLVCKQSGGTPTGELSTGAWYEIEVSDGDQWKPAPIYAEVCWEDIAWIIPAEDTTQWEVNWTWIYGTLPAGEYRIVKEIMDFRQPGDYDTCKSYAYFTIE